MAVPEAILGLVDGCQALGTPVTGGNVSFYNQTDGANILPTPVVGMLGVIDDVADRIGSRLRGTSATSCCWSATTREDLSGLGLGGRHPRPPGRRCRRCPTSTTSSGWPRCWSPPASATC